MPRPLPAAVAEPPGRAGAPRGLSGPSCPAAGRPGASGAGPTRQGGSRPYRFRVALPAYPASLTDVSLVLSRHCGPTTQAFTRCEVSMASTTATLWRSRSKVRGRRRRAGGAHCVGRKQTPRRRRPRWKGFPRFLSSGEGKFYPQSKLSPSCCRAAQSGLYLLSTGE